MCVLILQGKEEPNHFGVICRDPNNVNTYLSYVFKCESDSVVSEIIAGDVFVFRFSCTANSQRIVSKPFQLFSSLFLFVMTRRQSPRLENIRRFLIYVLVVRVSVDSKISHFVFIVDYNYFQRMGGFRN